MHPTDETLAMLKGCASSRKSSVGIGSQTKDPGCARRDDAKRIDWHESARGTSLPRLNPLRTRSFPGAGGHAPGSCVVAACGMPGKGHCARDERRCGVQ